MNNRKHLNKIPKQGDKIVTNSMEDEIIESSENDSPVVPAATLDRTGDSSSKGHNETCVFDLSEEPILSKPGLRIADPSFPVSKMAYFFVHLREPGVVAKFEDQQRGNSETLTKLEQVGTSNLYACTLCAQRGVSAVKVTFIKKIPTRKQGGDQRKAFMAGESSEQVHIVGLEETNTFFMSFHGAEEGFPLFKELSKLVKSETEQLERSVFHSKTLFESFVSSAFNTMFAEKDAQWRDNVMGLCEELELEFAQNDRTSASLTEMVIALFLLSFKDNNDSLRLIHNLSREALLGVFNFVLYSGHESQAVVAYADMVQVFSSLLAKDFVYKCEEESDTHQYIDVNSMLRFLMCLDVVRRQSETLPELNQDEASSRRICNRFVSFCSALRFDKTKRLRRLNIQDSQTFIENIDKLLGQAKDKQLLPQLYKAFMMFGDIVVISDKIRDEIASAADNDGGEAHRKTNIKYFENEIRDMSWYDYASFVLALSNNLVQIKEKTNPLSLEFLAKQIDNQLETETRIDGRKGRVNSRERDGDDEVTGGSKKTKAESSGFWRTKMGRITRGLNANTILLLMEVCLTVNKHRLKHGNIVGKLSYIITKNVEGTSDSMDLSHHHLFNKSISGKDSVGFENKNMMLGSVIQDHAMGVQNKLNKKKLRDDIRIQLKKLLSGSPSVEKTLSCMLEAENFHNVSELIRESFFQHELIDFSKYDRIPDVFRGYVISLYDRFASFLDSITPSSVPLTSLDNFGVRRFINYIGAMTKHLFAENGRFVNKTTELIFEQFVMKRFISQFDATTHSLINGPYAQVTKDKIEAIASSKSFVLFAECLVETQVLKTSLIFYKNYLSKGGVRADGVRGTNVNFMMLVLKILHRLFKSIVKQTIPVYFAEFLGRTRVYMWGETLYGLVEEIVKGKRQALGGEGPGARFTSHRQSNERLIKKYKDVTHLINVLGLEVFIPTLSEDRKRVFNADTFKLVDIEEDKFLGYASVVKRFSADDIRLALLPIFSIYYSEVKSNCSQTNTADADKLVGVLYQNTITALNKVTSDTSNKEISVREFNKFGKAISPDEIKLLASHFGHSMADIVDEMRRIQVPASRVGLFLKTLESFGVPFSQKYEKVFDEEMSVSSFIKIILKIHTKVLSIQEFEQMVPLLESISGSGSLLEFMAKNIPEDFNPDELINTWQREKIHSSNIAAIVSFKRCFEVLKTLEPLHQTRSDSSTFSTFFQDLRAWYLKTTMTSSLGDKALRDKSVISLLDDMKIASSGVLTIKDITNKSQMNNTMKILDRIERSLLPTTRFSIYSNGKYYIYLVEDSGESGEDMAANTEPPRALSPTEINELRTYTQLMDNTNDETSLFKGFKKLISKVKATTELVKLMVETGYEGMDTLLEYNRSANRYGFVKKSSEDIDFFIQNETPKLNRWSSLVRGACASYPYLNIVSMSEFHSLVALAKDEREFEEILADNRYYQIKGGIELYGIPFKDLYNALNESKSDPNFIEKAGRILSSLFNRFANIIPINTIKILDAARVGQMTAKGVQEFSPDVLVADNSISIPIRFNEKISSVCIEFFKLPTLIIECSAKEGRLPYANEILFCANSTPENEIINFFNLSYATSLNPIETVVQDKESMGVHFLHSQAPSEDLCVDSGPRRKKALFYIVNPLELSPTNQTLVENFINNPATGKFSRLLIINVVNVGPNTPNLSPRSEPADGSVIHQGNSILSESLGNVLNLRDKNTWIDSCVESFVQQVVMPEGSKPEAVVKQPLSQVFFKKVLKNREEDIPANDIHYITFVQSISPGCGKTYFIKRQLIPNLSPIEINITNDDSDINIIQRLEELFLQPRNEAGAYAFIVTLTLFPGSYKRFIQFVLQLYLSNSVFLGGRKLYIPSYVRKIIIELRDCAYPLANVFKYGIKTYGIDMNIDRLDVTKRNGHVKLYYKTVAVMEGFGMEDSRIKEHKMADVSSDIVKDIIINFVKTQLCNVVEITSFRSFKNMFKILACFAEGLSSFLGENKRVITVNKRTLVKALFTNSIIENFRVFNSSLKSKDYRTDMRSNTMDELIDNLCRWKPTEFANDLKYFFWVNMGGSFSYLYCKEQTDIPRQVENIFHTIYKDSTEYVKRNEDVKIPAYIKCRDKLNEEDCLRDIWKLCGKQSRYFNNNDYLNLDAVELLKKYALTYDNTIKMIQIFFRIGYNIPVGILGESGIGKTDLVRHLAVIADADLHTIQIHAGITGKKIFKFLQNVERGILEQERENRIRRLTHKIASERRVGYLDDTDEKSGIAAITLQSIKAEEKSVRGLDKSDIRNKEVWVFFDEANATEDIHKIEQVIFERRIYEYKLPKYFRFIYAVNPFRRLSGKETTLYTEYKYPGKVQELAYTVFPLPQAMKETLLNFGDLSDDYYSKYVPKIFKYEKKFILFGGKTIPLQKDKQKLFSAFGCRVLTHVRPFMRSYGINSALRELARFKYMFKTFSSMVYPFRIPDRHKGNVSMGKLYQGFFPVLKPFMLALGFVYFLRLPDAQAQQNFEDLLITQCKELARGFVLERGFLREWMRDDAEFLFSRFPLPPNIILNKTLIENLFVMLTSIRMRTPIIVIGKPGTSKTLSISLLDAECNGPDSKTENLRLQPNIHCVTYQGSKISTSESILYTFNKAVELARALEESQQGKGYKAQKTEELRSGSSSPVAPTMQMGRSYIANRVVFQFDEIGLAEQSGQKNALKTLHQMLEQERSSTGGSVGFVGITNYSLDLAKLSRAIVLIKPSLDRDDLKLTASSIMLLNATDITGTSQQIFNNDATINSIVEAFIEIIDCQSRLGRPEIYGMRNFYTMVKQVATILVAETSNQGKSHEEQQQEALDRLVLVLKRNFEQITFADHKELDPLAIFTRHLNLRTPSAGQQDTVASSLRFRNALIDNLLSRNSRHILLVADDDSIIADMFNIGRSTGRSITTMFHTGFSRDREDLSTYTENQLKKVIILMDPEFEAANGPQVVLFRQTTTIFPSLYPLLNQHYTLSKGVNSVLIAIGGSSDDSHTVSENFRIVTLLTKDELSSTDVAFLNRFEIRNATSECLIDEATEQERFVMTQCFDTLKELAAIGRVDIHQLNPLFAARDNTQKHFHQRQQPKNTSQADTDNPQDINPLVFSAFRSAKAKFEAQESPNEAALLPFIGSEMAASLLLTSNPYLRLLLCNSNQLKGNNGLQETLRRCSERLNRDVLDVLSLKDGLSMVLENNLLYNRPKAGSVGGISTTVGFLLDLKVSSTFVMKQLGDVVLNVSYLIAGDAEENNNEDEDTESVDTTTDKGKRDLNMIKGSFNIFDMTQQLLSCGEQEFRDAFESNVQKQLQLGQAALEEGNNQVTPTNIFLFNITETNHQSSFSKQLIAMIEELKEHFLTSTSLPGNFFFLVFIAPPSRQQMQEQFWCKLKLGFSPNITWMNLSTYLLKNPLVEIAFGIRSISSILDDDTQDERLNNMDLILSNIIGKAIQMSNYASSSNSLCDRFQRNFLTLSKENRSLRNLIKAKFENIQVFKDATSSPGRSAKLGKLPTKDPEAVISMEFSATERLLSERLATIINGFYNIGTMIPSSGTIFRRLFNSVSDLPTLLAETRHSHNTADQVDKLKHFGLIPNFFHDISRKLKKAKQRLENIETSAAFTSESVRVEQLKNLVYSKPLDTDKNRLSELPTDKQQQQIRSLKLQAMVFNYECLRVLYKFKLPNLDKCSGEVGERFLNFFFGLLEKLLPLRESGQQLTTYGGCCSPVVYKKSFVANMFVILGGDVVPEFNFNDFFTLLSYVVRAIFVIQDSVDVDKLFLEVTQKVVELPLSARLVSLFELVSSVFLEAIVTSNRFDEETFRYKYIAILENTVEALVLYLRNFSLAQRFPAIHDRVEFNFVKVKLFVFARTYINKATFKLQLTNIQDSQHPTEIVESSSFFSALAKCSTLDEIWDLKSGITYHGATVFSEVFTSVFGLVLGRDVSSNTLLPSAAAGGHSHVVLTAKHQEFLKRIIKDTLSTVNTHMLSEDHDESQSILKTFTILINNLFFDFPLHNIYKYMGLASDDMFMVSEVKEEAEKHQFIYNCLISALQDMPNLFECFYIMLVDEIDMATKNFKITKGLLENIKRLNHLLKQSKSASLEEANRWLPHYIFDIVVFKKIVSAVAVVGREYSCLSDGELRIKTVDDSPVTGVPEYTQTEKDILRSYIDKICHMINKGKIEGTVSVDGMNMYSDEFVKTNRSYQMCLLLTQQLSAHYKSDISIVNRWVKHNTTLLRGFYSGKCLYSRNGNVLSNIRCDPFIIVSANIKPGSTYHQKASANQLTSDFLSVIKSPPKDNLYGDLMLAHWLLSTNKSGKNEDIKQTWDYISKYAEQGNSVCSFFRKFDRYLCYSDPTCPAGYFGDTLIPGDKQLQNDLSILMAYTFVIAKQITSRESFMTYLFCCSGANNSASLPNPSQLYFPCMPVSSDYQLFSFYTNGGASNQGIKGIIVCNGCDKVIQIIDNNCGLPGESGRAINCNKCKNTGTTGSHAVIGGRYGFSCYNHYNVNSKVMDSYISKMMADSKPKKGYSQFYKNHNELASDASLGTISPVGKAVLLFCMDSLMLANPMFKGKLKNKLDIYLKALAKILCVSESSAAVFLLAIIPDILKRLNMLPLGDLKEEVKRSQFEELVSKVVDTASKDKETVIQAYRESFDYKGDPFILRIISDSEYNYVESSSTLYSPGVSQANPVPFLHKLFKPLSCPTASALMTKGGRLEVLLKNMGSINRRETVSLPASSRKFLQFIIDNQRALTTSALLKSFLSACRTVKEAAELLNIPVGCIIEGHQPDNPTADEEMDRHDVENSSPLSNPPPQKRDPSVNEGEGEANEGAATPSSVITAIPPQLVPNKTLSFNSFVALLEANKCANQARTLRSLHRDIVTFWRHLPDEVSISMNDNDCEKTAATNTVLADEGDSADFPVALLFPSLVSHQGDGEPSSPPLPLLSCAAIRAAGIEYNRLIRGYVSLSNTNNVFDRLPFYLDENNVVDDFDEELTHPAAGSTTKQLNLNSTALSNLMAPATLDPSLLLRCVHIIPQAIQDLYSGKPVDRLKGISNTVLLNNWHIDLQALLSFVVTEGFANKAALDTTPSAVVNFAGNREMDLYSMLVLVSEKYGSDVLEGETEATIAALQPSQGLEVHRILSLVIGQLYRLAATGVVLGRESEEAGGVTVGEGRERGTLTYMASSTLISSFVASIPLSMLYYAYERVERMFGDDVVASQCPALFREQVVGDQKLHVEEALADATEDELEMLHNLLVAFIVRRVIPFNRYTSLDRFYRVREATEETQLAHFLNGTSVVEWDFYEYQEEHGSPLVAKLCECRLNIYQAFSVMLLVGEVLGHPKQK